MKRERKQFGSVVIDKRIKTWHYLWQENGKRRSKLIGHKSDYPTKTSAWEAAKPLIAAIEKAQQAQSAALLVSDLVKHYRAEKMPTRIDTRRTYGAWLTNHILPRWGEYQLTTLQARPVEMWLDTLELSPKSKVHIRGLLRTLWDFAMWRGDVPTQRNPMELVTVKDAKKRIRPRSLTVEEFQKLADKLAEPFRTVALVCVCFGLRISECLALTWSDIDWLSSSLRVERGIVAQNVDEVKSSESRKQMSIDASLLEVLKTWKQGTQFSANEDWIFASPFQIGRLPYSYDQVWRAFNKASADAGIGQVSTHSMRHSYRSWLDAVGTTLAVQQKLMRHTDIRTTMNVYGDIITDEMAQAHSKVVGLALNRSTSTS
jgi:integrase